MLITIFKSNQKLVNGLTVLLTLAFWFPAFFSDLNSTTLITTNIKWVDILIAIFLIASQSIYLNFIASEYKLVKDSSHLTSLIFVLLNSCFLWLYELNEIVIANTFILIAFHQILGIYNSKNNFSILFNAGGLIGLATLIYSPAIIYFILLCVVLIYTTAPSWRDFIISLIGLGVPIIYYVVYKLVIGDLSEITVNDYLIQIFTIKWADVTLFNQLTIIILGLISLFAFMNLFVTIGKSVVKTSKMLTVVLFMFVFGVGSLFLNQIDILATFLMISVPLAVIVANFFQNIKRKWLAELLFTCLLVVVIIGYFS